MSFHIRNTKGYQSIIWAMCVSILYGCTTLNAVEMPTEQLRAEISSLQMVQPGDRVKIVTLDGKRHEFTVVQVTPQYVIGKKKSIEIESILCMEFKQFGVGSAEVRSVSKGVIYSAALFIVLIAGTSFEVE